MARNRRLSLARLESLVERRDCARAPDGELARAIRSCEAIRALRPEATCAVDPRDGMPILYSMARALRPHDTRPAQARAAAREAECPVCAGKTTGILDVAPVGQGAVTFINKNLYPILYPLEGPQPEVAGAPAAAERPPASGAHFLQWTSNRHDADLHNIGAAHAARLIERLGALEGTLLHEQGDLPRVGGPASACRKAHHGYVGVIKNYGHKVGGSLRHGHQQIVHTNVRPQRTDLDMRFLDREGRSVARFVLEESPAELVLADHGAAVLLTPWFLRRPLHSMIVVQDTRKSYLHELAPAERRAVARALVAAARAVCAIMPRLGRDPTYNLVVHNGPIGGLYLELLPWTQEIGGYEQLGLYICQGTPEHSHQLLREELGRRRGAARRTRARSRRG